MGSASGIVLRRHALSTEIQYREIIDGQTVADAVAGCAVPDGLLGQLLVMKNHFPVPRSEWSTTTLTAADFVFVSLVPAGGENKSAWHLVAALAAIATGYGAVALGAEVLFGAQVGMVAFGIMTSLIKPPAKPKVASEQDIYQFTGVSNDARPYSAVRRVYGWTKIMPDIAAQPFTVTVGDDQYLYALFDFGYSPMDVSDIRIDNSPIGNFQEVEYRIVEATTGDDLKIYENDHYVQPLNQVLPKDQTFTYPTSSGCREVVIDIHWPGGLVNYDTKHDESNERKIEFEIKFREYGTANWLSHKLSEWYSGTGDGTDRMVNVQVEANLAVNAKDVSGNDFPGASNIWSIVLKTVSFQDDLPLIIYSPSYTPVAGDTLLACGVRVKIAGAASLGGGRYRLTFSDVVYLIGHYFETVVSASNPTPTLSQYRTGATIAKKTHDGIDYTDSRWIVKRAKTKAFTSSLTLLFSEPGRWEVSIKRLTDVSESPPDHRFQVQDRSTLASIRSVRYSSPINLRTPHTMLEIKIKATEQISGTLDTLSGVVQAAVPVFYGTGPNDYAVLPSRSPAWAALDVLRGVANRHAVPHDLIDIQSFINFASWCSKTAPNSDEQYFLCDLALNDSTTVMDACNTILAAGRGTLSVTNGKYGVIWDEPKSLPVQMITTHNATEISGSRAFVDMPHAIRVSFKDPLVDWEESEVIIYADGYNAANAEKFESTRFVGVQRATQIWRDARYQMANAIYRSENITATMDFENLVCTRGDLVLVQEDAYRIGGLPGRIKALSIAPRND